MGGGAWGALGDEIARWRDCGRSVEFWWRDDDAAQRSAALERLLELSSRYAVPLALAVIPQRAERALFDGLPRTVTVLQHGTDHRNRAAAGEKKTEFPAGEPVPAALARLAAARERLRAMCGGQAAIDVLAPPWNRLPAPLAHRLGEAGFRGLSRYGMRAASDALPIPQANTHVDIVGWRANGDFVGEDAAISQALRHLAARRSGGVTLDEATGWLTHHERHDAAAWRFLARLFETTVGAPGVVWRRAEALFALSPA